MGKEKFIQVGSVLIYHTCKSFDPITREEFEKYDEHYLVQNIKKEGFYLFNLDKAKFQEVMPRGTLNYLLADKKIEISEEVA